MLIKWLIEFIPVNVQDSSIWSRG